MSLRVWLPLNGDLTNNGLSNVTVTNNGATVDNNGKIGKCYSFDGSNDKISGIYNANLNISFCCWINIITLKNCHILDGRLSDASKGYQPICITNNGTTIQYGSTGSGWRNYNYSFVVNTWYHIAVIHNETIGKLYINGILVDSSTTAKGADLGQCNFTLGCRCNSTNCANVKINDFRIYDHVLSAKEVKEISKGLVCHYKLDNDAKGGQENLYDFQSVASKWTADGATRENYTDPVYGNVLKINSSSGNKRIYRGVSNIWTQGQIYTVSFLAKADSNCICDMSRSVINLSPQFNLSTEWKRYSGQINCTETSAGGTLSFRVLTTGINVYITQVKLEYGEIATAYRPNINDPDYNKLGYNNITIYDCSGYNYHGTSHTIEINSESPRYNLSTYLNGTNSSYINTLYSTNIGTSDFTISLWIKIPTISSGSYYAVCTSKTTAGKSSGFGIYWNYTQKKFLWSTADGTTATEIFMATAVDSIVYDNWIHLVMVRNSSDTKKGYFYINGIRYELASVPVIRDITTDTKLFLGTCTNIYYYLKAYYSDFRIYATALSEDDIKELYQTSASIDKDGNVFAYEFKED